MILDERTEFVDSAQPAAGIAGDVIDLQGGGPTAGPGALPLQARDVGAGHPIYFVATVETAGAGGPITINLITADNAALSTNPVTVLAFTGVLATVANQKFAATLPQGFLYKRYLGVTVTGTAMTGGTMSAFLTLDVSSWRAYEDAAN